MCVCVCVCISIVTMLHLIVIIIGIDDLTSNLSIGGLNSEFSFS